MSHIVQNFDSWSELLAECEDDSLPRWGDSSRNGTTTFTKTSSYEEAVSFASSGWKAGLDKVVQCAANTSLQAQGRAPSWDYAPAGYLPCVPAMVAGDPCHMMTRGESFSGGRPIVRIVVSSEFTCEVDAEHVFNRGAAIMGIIDFLESQEMRAEVSVSLSAEGDSSHTYESLVTVKSAEEPLDRDRMIFAIANASFLRRLSFHLFERIPEFEDSFGFGYGHPFEPKLVPEDAVYIPRYRSGCETAELAQNYIVRFFEDALTQQQIEAIKESL